MHVFFALLSLFLLKHFFERSWWRRLAALRQHQSPPHERRTVTTNRHALPSARSPLAPSFVGASGECVLEAEAGIDAPDERGILFEERAAVDTDHQLARRVELEVHRGLEALKGAPRSVGGDVEPDLTPPEGDARPEPVGDLVAEVPPGPEPEVVGASDEAVAVPAEAELVREPASNLDGDLAADDAPLRRVDAVDADHDRDLGREAITAITAIATVAAVGAGGTLRSDGALDQHGRGGDRRLRVLERLDARFVVGQRGADLGDLGVDGCELDLELTVAHDTVADQHLEFFDVFAVGVQHQVGAGGAARLLGGGGGRRRGCVGAHLRTGGLQLGEPPLRGGDLGGLRRRALLVAHLELRTGLSHARGRGGGGGGSGEREEGQDGEHHGRSCSGTLAGVGRVSCF